MLFGKWKKFFVVPLFILLIPLTGCSHSTPSDNSASDTPQNQNDVQPSDEKAVPPPAESNSELKIEDIAEGEGEGVKSGDTVSVNYAGTLPDGTEFDSSYKRSEPFSFTVGQGLVIAGWDQGLIGMKVGGKRKLTIPPNLAYGDRAVGDKIPPQSTLVFEIELLKINESK